MRITIVASHPIQYQAPLFRELARRCDVHVLFAHRANAVDQSAAGFNVGFEWDIDLTGGFEHTFLENVARRPGLGAFGGCDTPGIGASLRRLEPDAVILMGWHLKCFWQAIWEARRSGVLVMVRGDSHLETPRSFLKRAGKAVVYPVALRMFDAALYVGERSRRYWEHYGYPKERMFFAPHCVDNNWFRTLATTEARERLRQTRGISDDAFVVLFAGKLLPFKRPVDVVEAAAQCRLAGRSVEVLVAGSGELDQQMVHRTAELGVPLHMLGFCNQTQMPAAYAASDVLVLPSNGNETWGLVANEALASGRPVIVSDACGSAPDLAADGTAGRIFPWGDIAGLAQAIEKILDAAPSTEAIAAKANKYSLAAAADGVISAVSLVSGGGRSRQAA